MQETSALYKQIIAEPNHWFEVSLATGQIGTLLTDTGDELLFGGYSILLSGSDADGGYRENVLMDMSTTRSIFADGKPSVGGAIAGELNATLLRPAGEIPKMARLVPFVRVTNGTDTSEWIKKGVYYIDTRSFDQTSEDVETMTIHAYDDMLKSEQDYVPTMQFPATDIDVIRDVANKMGVSVDSRTVDAISNGYSLTLPTGYSCREMLCYIAAMYAGNFIMSDEGRLLFVGIGQLEPETNYVISFGGDILVWDDTSGVSGELVRILV